MGTINVTLPADGETADAADVNTPINTIVNEFNGNIDNANIKSAAAISGSKLADNSIDLESKVSNDTGWREVTDSWAYASATTITVPSDATAKYSVGDKLRLTQSTVKYFYVTAVTTTVLTITGGTDYTLTNAAISDISYSKSATPSGFPQVFSYAPTWGNVTQGNGTLTSKFSMNGKEVSVDIHLVFGNTSSSTNNTILAGTLPVAAHAMYTATSLIPTGNLRIQDTGVAVYVGYVRMGLNEYQLTRFTTPGTNIQETTIPALGNTDELAFSFRYKAA